MVSFPCYVNCSRTWNESNINRLYAPDFLFTFLPHFIK